MFFIVNLLEKHPSERDIHLPLLKNAIINSSTSMFNGVKERLLPQIFKRRDLRDWFMSFYEKICGKSCYFFSNFFIAEIDNLALLSISLFIMETDSDNHWSDFVKESQMLQSLIHSDASVSRFLSFACFFRFKLRLLNYCVFNKRHHQTFA